MPPTRWARPGRSRWPAPSSCFGRITGPLFGYSDAWQLVINTGTTIVTFLMVFLIQNTQNRDARAIHLKLDELIRSIHAARNRLIDLENCTDEELDRSSGSSSASRRRRVSTGATRGQGSGKAAGKRSDSASG